MFLRCNANQRDCDFSVVALGDAPWSYVNMSKLFQSPLHYIHVITFVWLTSLINSVIFRGIVTPNINTLVLNWNDKFLSFSWHLIIFLVIISFHIHSDRVTNQTTNTNVNSNKYILFVILPCDLRDDKLNLHICPKFICFLLFSPLC